jgi:transposase
MAHRKTEFLRSEGLLNPRPERVTHPLFETLDFFDPLDLPQVRYEMLRAARVDKVSVADACRMLGLSREYFYRLERKFMERGYVALLGSPNGRPPLLALNQEVLCYIVYRKLEQPSLSGEQLRKEILKLHKVDCSRRTVERLIEKLDIERGGLRSPSR